MADRSTKQPQTGAQYSVDVHRPILSTHDVLTTLLGDIEGVNVVDLGCGSGRLTRSLLAYRWGDSTRLIHWRTSARYGELRVRELEEQTAENQVLIGLDTSAHWTAESFEAAVIAAASLYIYSLQRQLSVVLWLPQTGLLQNHHTVLSALAEVMPAPAPPTTRLPDQPLLWLSPSGTVPALPSGSIWVQWQGADTAASPPLSATLPTLRITTTQDLTTQLQSDWRQTVEPR